MNGRWELKQREERLRKDAVNPVTEFWGEPIHTYTRKQAIEDSFLVDVSEMARPAGIKYPVAITSAVFHDYVTVPEGVTCQDENGRLWDILWMYRNHAKGALKPVERWREGSGAEVMLFQLRVRNENAPAKLVTLKAHCGPGDQAEPVITIMLPDED